MTGAGPGVDTSLEPPVAGVQVLPVTGIPEIRPGTDLGAQIRDALGRCRRRLRDGDIVVITSKVVSKAEGRFVRSADRGGLTLSQSRGVVTERATTGGPTRVVASAAGPVMAGAGIDASNIGDDRYLLLPADPDASAERVHAQLAAALPAPCRFAVLLSDTSGRPWRNGVSDFALGCHGLRTLDDLRGKADTHGRDLAVTVRNLADEIAAAADLVKGKLNRVPVALVRGLEQLVVDPDHGDRAAQLIRTGPSDWFSMGRAEAVRAALGVPPGSPLSAQVGIESVQPEPLAERIARCLRVAAADGGDAQAEQSAADAADRQRALLTVRAADPVDLGRRWARLEVALAGERLACTLLRRDPSSIVLTVTRQD